MLRDLAGRCRGRCTASAWVGFAYVTLFSMWLGFFAWYRGLALGGVMRVSQVQLLQPFLALLFAVPLLGERLEATTLLFALAVAGRRRARQAPAAAGTTLRRRAVTPIDGASIAMETTMPLPLPRPSRWPAAPSA